MISKWYTQVLILGLSLMGCSNQMQSVRPARTAAFNSGSTLTTSTPPPQPSTPGSSSTSTPPKTLADVRVLAMNPTGIVHLQECDSSLPQKGFVKNWWDRQGGATALRDVVRQSSLCGQMQTPLIVANWDFVLPASIQSAMTDFFRINPEVPVWEFGLEENLGNGDGCCSAGQLELLNKKLAAVQAAKIAASTPNIQVAYQLASRDPALYKVLLNSGAAAHIDVLAAHPYGWPDFPTPETWHV